FAQVPWAVPPAEDLARGADLKLLGERTVALVPHAPPAPKHPDGQEKEAKEAKPAEQIHVRLVFAEDGRLAERLVIRMPKDEVLLREVCTADGAVRVLDGKGKELAAHQGTLAPAQAPDLSPDTKKLVVLPL